MELVLLFLFVFFAEFFFQNRWIIWMQRRQIGQVIKEYGPKTHAVKAGTPSMGGVVFLLLSIALALYGYGECGYYESWGGMLRFWGYPVAAALIGLWDDWKKYSSHSSEGLSSLQKLFAQIAVTLPWAVYYAFDGIAIFPQCVTSDWMLTFGSGVAVLMFLGVGILNAVNVTDGLDGLAAGAMSLSLLAIMIVFKGIRMESVVLLACLVAFLWDNTNPARIFMGDIGAHFLGAFLINACVLGGEIGLIIPFSFLYGVEMISVVIQIIAIRCFNRKVFLMSPLHHHFEMLGWSEGGIVVRFWIVHLVGMASLWGLMNTFIIR